MNPMAGLLRRGAVMSAAASMTKAGMTEAKVARPDMADGGKASPVGAVPGPKPRRPMSAYNLFFKQEREKLLGTATPGTQSDTANGLLDRIIANGGGLSPVRGDKGSKRERGTKGKMGHAELARGISRKWKMLDESSRSVFEALALLERKKYERQLELWERQRSAQEISHTKSFVVSNQEPTVLGKRKYLALTPNSSDDEENLEEEEDEHAKKRCRLGVKQQTKNVLPHMLGQGRGMRFGVPKHVMEQAFSKSRGQQRIPKNRQQRRAPEQHRKDAPKPEIRQQFSQQQEKKKTAGLLPKSTGDNATAAPPSACMSFGVPSKAFGRMYGQKNRRRKKSRTERRPHSGPQVPKAVCCPEVKEPFQTTREETKPAQQHSVVHMLRLGVPPNASNRRQQEEHPKEHKVFEKSEVSVTQRGLLKEDKQEETAVLDARGEKLHTQPPGSMRSNAASLVDKKVLTQSSADMSGIFEDIEPASVLAKTPSIPGNLLPQQDKELFLSVGVAGECLKGIDSSEPQGKGNEVLLDSVESFWLDKMVENAVEPTPIGPEVHEAVAPPILPHPVSPDSISSENVTPEWASNEQSEEELNKSIADLFGVSEEKISLECSNLGLDAALPLNVPEEQENKQARSAENNLGNFSMPVDSNNDYLQETFLIANDLIEPNKMTNDSDDDLDRESIDFLLTVFR